jgi:hypothetical protein
MSSLLDKNKYSFGRSAAVPAGGTLQLFATGQTLQGFRVIRAGKITGLSVRVNAADGARTYQLQVFVNGVLSTAVLTLASGSTSASTTALALAVAAGDIITAFMVRTAGAGASTFGDEAALVELTEE